ncbi:MAG: mannonate dehydratase [Salinivirgaceae bacterium]|jgi:mannonate dehydratase|nr:mannonate dehydratase [Salinivirgaceae bacterium]
MHKKAGFEQTWRWFGSTDRITLADIKQTGATGIVSALHQIPVGEVWNLDAIQERKTMIEAHGLSWSVVESVPVSEDIKKQIGNYKVHIENYKLTLKNLSACGIKTVCYNFMPVLDWSRTNLNFKYDNNSESLKYEYHKFAAFDLYILKRQKAFSEYSNEIIGQAKVYYESLTKKEREELKNTILLGLPGSLKAYTLEEFQKALDSYKHINKEKLQSHLIHFLNEIVPIAEKENIKLAIHPDDPPWAQLGLPRIVSNYNDLKNIIESVPSPSNGITLCTGSLGAGYDNDLVKMSIDFAPKIHFTHLRNVTRDVDRNFMENNLFDGDINILQVTENLIKESIRRQKEQRSDMQIPMRPDHGFQILGDIGQENYPGYGLYGRMKSLAELRGLERGILDALSQ